MINKVVCIDGFSNSSKVNFKSNNVLETEKAYNYSDISTANKLSIPEVAPVEIPSDLNTVSGERIYNSEGKLLEIKDNNTTRDLSYKIMNDQVYYTKMLDKTNGIVAEQYNVDDNMVTVMSTLPNGVTYETVYENGTPSMKSKTMVKDNRRLSVSYDNNLQEYNVIESSNGSRDKLFNMAVFDGNKQCKSSYESANGVSRTVSFYNGVPYSVNVMVERPIANNIKIENMNMENLEPAPYYNVNYDKITAINGEKVFYSNGKPEKITAEDGTVYNFNTDGKLRQVVNENKNIRIEDKNQVIIEKISEDTTKSTFYGKDGITVIVESNDESRLASYYPNERLAEYNETDKDGYRTRYEFNKDGMVTNIWSNKD